MRRQAGFVAVLDAVECYLRVRHGEDIGAVRLLNRLGDARPASSGPPIAPIHDRSLATALARLCGSGDDLLAEVGRAIRTCGPLFEWRVDDGLYYPPGAPISGTYRDGNMHTILAEGDDFAMGLFLLEPQVDYLDHRHAAPEFYLNLTGPTDWRFDFGAWLQLPAGSVLWNDPGRVHATRTGAEPWLSLWAWLSDVDQPCEVLESRPD